jgi:enamine deaminase RidA (YjgF/YER057c/UK114 family)
MSRTFIHPYQTRYHAQAIYSKAIRAKGDFVFMQGQVGTLLDGTLIGPGDPRAQADQTCRNIDQWMTEAGGSLKDVFKLTVYVTHIDYRPAVYDAINRWFDGVQHCSTGVVVQGLADPSLLGSVDI